MITLLIMSIVVLAGLIVALAALGIIGGVLGAACLIVGDIAIGLTPFVAAGYLVWWLLFAKRKGKEGEETKK